MLGTERGNYRTFKRPIVLVKGGGVLGLGRQLVLVECIGVVKLLAVLGTSIVSYSMYGSVWTLAQEHHVTKTANYTGKVGRR